MLQLILTRRPISSWTFLTDTALKVSRSLYCFTTSISHGVESYFPRLWGMGISDAFLCHFR